MTGLDRGALFLEVCKLLFDLELPPGRWYASPRNILEGVGRVRDKRQKRDVSWKIYANVDNSEVFFSQSKRPRPSLPRPLEKADTSTEGKIQRIHQQYAEPPYEVG